MSQSLFSRSYHHCERCVLISGKKFSDADTGLQLRTCTSKMPMNVILVRWVDFSKLYPSTTKNLWSPTSYKSRWELVASACIFSLSFSTLFYGGAFPKQGYKKSHCVSRAARVKPTNTIAFLVAQTKAIEPRQSQIFLPPRQWQIDW